MFLKGPQKEVTFQFKKKNLLGVFFADANQSCHRVIKRLSLGKNAIVFKCINDQHALDASRIRYLTMRQ